MKESEKTVRNGDLLFCGAPHLFIAHERCVGKWADDSRVNCDVATTYFELIANSYRLGKIIMSYPAEVLNELSPKAREMLTLKFDEIIENYHLYQIKMKLKLDNLATAVE